jgi:hypothetical protein
LWHGLTASIDGNAMSVTSVVKGAGRCSTIPILLAHSIGSGNLGGRLAMQSKSISAYFR